MINNSPTSPARMKMNRTSEFYARLAESIEWGIEIEISEDEFVYAPITDKQRPGTLGTRRIIGPAVLTGRRYENGTITVDARFIGTPVSERIYASEAARLLEEDR